ncbi:MAG: TetR/AcrR family transcriptional regulator [Erysipelotrichaceae bacterium]|nr:TetR/AcrR family transcriptional regulator [Erysipelotrichaceae bacterium]
MNRAEKQICEAMIELMEEKPFESIRVTELAGKAGISRSSFYTHFDSIYDVLQLIEDDFLEHIIDEKEVGLDNDMSVVENNFSYIRDNLRTLQTLIGVNGDDSFGIRLGNRSKRILDTIVDNHRSRLNDTQLIIVNEFAKAGKMQVFKWWAENQNSVSVKEVMEMLEMISDAINDVVVERKD